MKPVDEIWRGFFEGPEDLVWRWAVLEGPDPHEESLVAEP
jgi:hypothetical protein